MRINLIVVTIFLLAGQVYSQEKKYNYPVTPEKTNCDSIMISGMDTVRVISLINNSSFRIEQSFRLTRKNGLQKASYYSCDGLTGYLVFKYKNKEYYREGINIHDWENLKKSPDPEGVIKHTYLK